MIGAPQWMVTIGRFDIFTAVMSLSSFRAEPRVGHLERLKRIYGFLSKIHHAVLQICTEEPEYLDLQDLEHDLLQNTYCDIILQDAPEPLGKKHHHYLLC
jgi:hypothetical protein